jgi:hemin uptake protein HemP
MTDHEPASQLPSAQPLAQPDFEISAEQSAGQSAAADSACSREKWNSTELLGDRIEVLIQHGSETYRLHRTRQDKLILYK